MSVYFILLGTLLELQTELESVTQVMAKQFVYATRN